MLVQMPNWYVTFVKYHVIEGSEVQYSVESKENLGVMGFLEE